MLSRFYSWLQGLWAIFALSSHLGAQSMYLHNAVHQRLAGWAARAQQRGRGRCMHAHAHSGIQAPGCGDASRFALYLEDSAEPLKTRGEGARQDLPRTLAARVPPPPTGCRVCSFRSFSDAPFTWNHVYAGPGRGQETHRRRSYYTCCLHLVLFFI